MFSLNRATIIGNLTRDPDLRYTPSGQAVASFSVATNRRWTTADGTKQDDTQYHEVVAWGKLAEITQQFLAKGRKVYIEGRLQTRSWEAPDGTKRNRTEIVTENLIMLTPRGTTESSEYSSQNIDTAFPAAKATDSPGTKTKEKTPTKPSITKKGLKNDSEGSKDPTEVDEGEINLDDIPF